MKVENIIIKLWLGNEIRMTCKINALGRFHYPFPPGEEFDLLTIEPDDPNSKVTMTHYGAKYSP